MTAHPAVASDLPDSSPRLIAATDQSVGRILVFDFALEESRVEGCPPGTVWSWQPSDDNAYNAAATNWGRPSDVRLRRDQAGKPRMLVADSYGLTAVVGSHGQLLWSADAGPHANPHAAELLPDGAVAVAASTGGWIRLYPGLSSARDDQFAQFDLDDAHGVLWDPGNNVLWALGGSQLCRLHPTGTGTTKQLLQLAADPLPSPGGHDLQAVYGDRDLLWVTTSCQVYQYSKSRRTWSTAYPHASAVNCADVKSIGTNPTTGEVLQTIPAPGADPYWVTDTIEIVAAARRRIRREGRFYKARYWVADYY